MTEELVVRRYEDSDEAAVLDMLATSLGWMPDGLHRDFFRWKHFENPAGPSPAWVAVEGDRLAGVRMLLRWRFRDGAGVHDAVRAVDTATHPDFRGRGIFTTLTMTAVEELTAEGVGFVFNTPNDQSRPGYLKMGWSDLGRVPIAMRPRTPWSLVRMARARTAADLWSQPCHAFEPAGEAFADTGAVDALVAATSSEGVLVTERTAAHLRWRYGFEPLHYRVATHDGALEAGAVVFRLRRRGGSLEAAICELLIPHGHPRRARSLVGQVLRRTKADYAVAMSAGVRQAMVPLRGQGPILTRRPLADPTVGTIDDFALGLGDVELF